MKRGNHDLEKYKIGRPVMPSLDAAYRTDEST